MAARTAKKAVKKVVAKGVVKKSRDPVITTDLRGAAVDELPVEERKVSDRQLRYQTAMRKVREEVGAGKWVPIATFAGRGGATQVRRAIEKGERPIDGDAGDWGIQSRTNADGGSTLWVRLNP